MVCCKRGCLAGKAARSVESNAETALRSELGSLETGGEVERRVETIIMKRSAMVVSVIPVAVRKRSMF